MAVIYLDNRVQLLVARVVDQVCDLNRVIGKANEVKLTKCSPLHCDDMLKNWIEWLSSVAHIKKNQNIKSQDNNWNAI